jgi:hypothetical protein
VTAIVLCTLNAKWEHASFGLRSLRANLGELMEASVIVERTIHDRASDVVEELLAHQPRIVGLGVYVWNAPLMLEIVRQLKTLRPDLFVVVGGPEVSHEVDAQEICTRADFVVTGEGELAFRALCAQLLAGMRPLLRVLDGGRPALANVQMPYALYTDEDLRNRIVYVEASRGCPFTCEFCLSALDDGVRTFPLDAFLAEMGTLMERGLRRFKFVDRTFNLKIDDSARILAFFRERALAEPGLARELFLHFEMIPDRLPERLRQELVALSRGAGVSVQLEVGIQTFADDVAARIARRQDGARIVDNLGWLREHTDVHVHADLIVGLPGEDLASFGRGFDRLFTLAPNEIQVGVLKRLRGAPIKRHDAILQYSASAPYEVLATDALPFGDIQRLKRFARYFDLVHNSGRFPQTARLLLDGAPFAHMLALADWLWAETRATAGIAAARLATLLERHLVDARALDPVRVREAIQADVGRDRVSHLPRRQGLHAAR